MNTGKTQIRIAVSVHVLVAIVKKRLAIDASRYTLLQILSVTLFEKMPLQQAFPGGDSSSYCITINNQSNLVAFSPDSNDSGVKMKNHLKSRVPHQERKRRTNSGRDAVNFGDFQDKLAAVDQSCHVRR